MRTALVARDWIDEGVLAPWEVERLVAPWKSPFGVRLHAADIGDFSERTIDDLLQAIACLQAGDKK